MSDYNLLTLTDLLHWHNSLMNNWLVKTFSPALCTATLSLGDPHPQLWFPGYVTEHFPWLRAVHVSESCLFVITCFDQIFAVFITSIDIYNNNPSAVILYSPKFSQVKCSHFNDIQLFYDKIFEFTKNAHMWQVWPLFLQSISFCTKREIYSLQTFRTIW